MIKLVKGRSNTISVRVRSFINYTGFSATLLMANGLQKYIPVLSDKNPTITFTKEDIDFLYGRGQEGVLTVNSVSSGEYSKQRIFFLPVNDEKEALNFQTIYVNLVQDLKNNGGGGCHDCIMEPRISALEFRLDELEKHIDEVIVEKIEIILPTVVRPLVIEVVKEIAEPMMDQKIEDAIGVVNRKLDELNGEEI